MWRILNLDKCFYSCRQGGGGGGVDICYRAHFLSPLFEVLFPYVKHTLNSYEFCTLIHELAFKNFKNFVTYQVGMGHICNKNLENYFIYYPLYYFINYSIYL